MHLCKLNLIYVILVVMLECQMRDTGATKQRRSSIFVQTDEDLRSLEMCTARNQQRLGSVFGNITRHHKKGHRRKPTTTIPTTVTATYEDTTLPSNVATTEPFRDSNLPTPQRLTADEGETVNVATALNKQIEEEEIIDYIERERHKTKHRERHGERETAPETSQVSNRHKKVKKMYRDSTSSTINKLNSKAKNSIFLTENCTSVIAQIGTTAILHCEVSDITENTVTWIRRKDYSLLSVGLVTYSADNRFFSAHGRHVKDWALHIRFATSADAGFYECQVPTHPPTSIFFKLVLVAAYAEIVGESEKIIHEGSMLRLVCVVRRSTEPPSYVFWYFENRMINYDLNGVTVHNGRQTSELVIGKAEPRHAGNYTCVPANAKAASVTVHVVQSETPAAMQHGNNSSCTEKVNPCIVLLAYIILLRQL